MLALATGLVRAGHRVRVVTGSGFLDEVRATGAEPVPLPPESDVDEERIAEAFPERTGLRGPAAARFDMGRIFLDPVPGQVAAIDRAMAAEPVGAIVAEPLFLAGLALVGRPSPPVLTLGTMPPLGRQSAMPPVGPPLTGLGPVGPAVHLGMHRAAQRVMFGSVQRRAEKLFASIGEPPPRTFFLDWPLAGSGLLQLSVPSFEPIDGMAVPVHHVGTLSAPPGTPSSDPPTWWSRVERAVDRGTPVVHVTQGTVANADLGQLVMPTIRALAERPVLVVATTGGREVDRAGTPLPDNAILTDWVDYARLLPHVAAMVTNGGYGGVHEALRHGVPLVLAGAEQDKAAVAARLRRSGAGVAVTTLTPTEATLDRLVGRVLHDPRHRHNAEHIAADLAAAPGLSGAVEIIERAMAD